MELPAYWPCVREQLINKQVGEESQIKCNKISLEVDIRNTILK